MRWKTSKQAMCSRRASCGESTDFLMCVVSEKVGRGTISFTHVCEHCKLFPVEDCSHANHGEKKEAGLSSFDGSLQPGDARCLEL